MLLFFDFRFYDEKSAADALGAFVGVDAAAQGAGLLLDLAALNNKKARARRLVKKIAFLINIHMLGKTAAN